MKAARASVNRDRNTSFMAYEDLPREDYQLKKKAQKQMDQAYKQGKKVRFWRGNMWINGKIEESRKGFSRKNIVAVLRSRTFFLKINKLPIFSEITQE